MMKKGFTLIELLGVIVILGIIGLIIVPVVQGVIRNSSTTLCKDQIEIFKKAAKNYVAAHPYEDYNNSEKTLQNFVDEGLLEESQLENPKGGIFKGKIRINYNGTNYSYEYIYASGETEC